MGTTTTRHATLADLAALLTEQQARKVDLVAPAARLQAVEGALVVEGSEPVIDEDGVTLADGVYQPTQAFIGSIAYKLGIPQGYLRRLYDDRADLYDANVNGWLHGPGGTEHDPRKFLVRLFKAESEGTPGIARAFLSDGYRIVDHLDTLTAALDGVRQANVGVTVSGADLTESRMVVRIEAPEVTAYAGDLLKGYRSPFNGQTGDQLPLVHAGLVLSNSEVGHGAFSLVPRIVFQVCSNGMTVTKDALRSVHLGGKMDEGIIRWSQDTEDKNLALVTARARDAVRTFLDLDYMVKVVARLTEQAGAPLPGDPTQTVRTVGKKLAFTEDTINGVLSMFIQGGQTTAGGVMQAVTAYAQTVDDGDLAYELEGSALRALELASA